MYSVDTADAIRAIVQRGHMLEAFERAFLDVKTISSHVDRVSKAVRNRIVAMEAFEQQLEIVLAEGFQNAVRNRDASGAHDNTYREGWFHHGFFPHLDEWIYVCHIADPGKGFHPHRIRNPLHPDNLLKGNGRGVLLMGSYASTFGTIGYLPMEETDNGEMRTNELCLLVHPTLPQDTVLRILETAMNQGQTSQSGEIL